MFRAKKKKPENKPKSGILDSLSDFLCWPWFGGSKKADTNDSGVDGGWDFDLDLDIFN